MTTLRNVAIAAALSFAPAALAGPAPTRAAAAPVLAGQDGADPVRAAYQRLVNDVVPAVVTIKYVLKVDAAGHPGLEQEMEIAGLVIDPAGLVLASNSQMGGQYGMQARYDPSSGITVSPTDVKILFGDDVDGIAARVLARDSDLDLAWLQIEGAEGREFPHVDFGRATDPEVGDRLFTISRLGKYFDRATVVSEGRVAGKTRKPRPLIIPNALETTPGMPVFAADGSPIGVSALQPPPPEDLEANAGGQMNAYMGYDRVVLPAAEVMRATQRTRDLAASGRLPTDLAEGEAGGGDADENRGE